MIISGWAVRFGWSVVTEGVKFSGSKKRLVVLSITAAVALGVGAVQAGAIAGSLNLRGKGTFCLSPEAARNLAARSVTFEAIAPATVDGTCVTMPGAGTLAPDLTGGEVPLEGGMRFQGSGHRLDITRMSGHVRLNEGYNTADVAVDGGPAANLDIAHWPVSMSRVSMTPTTVSMKDNPLTLTDAAKAAFAQAFGAGPTAEGQALFLFTGKAEITNPFGGLSRP
ncbi:HtaA domain-containing protein [Streptomyces sp. NPDC060028]|uniref:HtaA domain-containing protein n=1 Tax=Streptomyces sp. NPDC060028 TaxID=3347041 RepID=UPI0036C2AB7D